MIGDFTHPHFAEPHWLWLAVIAPAALILLQRFAGWRRRRQLAQFADPEIMASLLQSHSPARRIFKNALLVLAVAGFGVALARPQWGETTESARALGEDIMFVLDCSRSMLATDVQPDRLGRAKYAILDFVQRHGNGRVGLVAFAGQAFLQCPLTYDVDAFREALLAMDDRTIPVGGTDIGRALDEASLALEKNDRRKVLVLLTDGEDLEKSGIAKAKALAEKHIVIYPIGVGTAAGTVIKVTNEQGFPETVHDPEGKVVQSRLDESTLTAIAQATHGSYHPLGPVGEGLTAVRNQVEAAAEQADSGGQRKSGIERFHVPLAIVVLLLGLESLIGTRRKVRQIGESQTS